MVNLPTKIKISPDALFENLDDRSVILHISKERYYTLDDVGSAMWNALAENNNVEEVLTNLLNLYDVDRQTLTNDLHDFIGKLKEADLLMLD